MPFTPNLGSICSRKSCCTMMLRKWTIPSLVVTSVVVACCVLTHVLYVLLPGGRSSTLHRKMERLPPLKGPVTSYPTYQTAVDASRSASVRIYDRPEDFPQYFRPKLFRVTPLDFSFLIDSSEACGEDEAPPFLVVLVISMADHAPERDAIRSTWGRVARGLPWPGEKLPGPVKLLFLFGDTGSKQQTQQLEREALLHHDIIMANFREAYFNLTYKVLMGFKWLKTFCPSARYVMKADEDTFVHLPQVGERLASSDWNTRICGFHTPGQIRFDEGKYRVEASVYPFHFYPPHVKGNVYFMSTAIALRLLTVAEFMPYVNMEDAHITGILARTIGVQVKGFYPREYSPGSPPRDPCSFATKRSIAARVVTPELAAKYWSKIENAHTCYVQPQSRT